VSIAPRCVERILTQDVACRRLRVKPGTEQAQSRIELAWRRDENRPIVETFCRLARKKLMRGA